MSVVEVTPQARRLELSVTPESRQVLMGREQTISLDYGWIYEDNREWRECAAEIVRHLEVRWPVEEISVPPFTPYEDFVELEYFVRETRVSISSDRLLNTIWIHCRDKVFLRELLNYLGGNLGWTAGTAQS